MADNERVISTVFKADISQFSASTQQLSRYIDTVNSEFKNATASMGRWNDNTEGLRLKIQQLNKVLDAEEKKLEQMQADYAKLVAEGKENTAEAQRLAIAINNQGAKVKSTSKDIKYYSDQLNELEDAGADTREELDKLNKELDEQKKSAKELSGNVLKGFAVGLAGIATACVGAIAGLNNLVEETKELRTQLAQIETAFEGQGHSVETAKKTYEELYGVLGDSGKATEASLHLAEFATTEEELAELTNSLTGAYARFGDSLPLENIAEGVSTTLSLNQANAGMVDAIEFAGGNVEEFNEKLQSLDTEEQKRAFILETLNGIYGEAGEQYKENNKDVIKANEAQMKYNEALASIAEKAQPALTEFKLAMIGVLETVLAKLNEVDLEGLIGKISDAITTVVNASLPPLMTALTWILDNLNWLAPLLGTVIGLIGGITAGIKIYNSVVQIAKTVQMAWNLAMSANPIGIVITAISLLVTAFVTLWNKCEGFRKFWINLWESIKSVAKIAGDFISGIFESISGAIKGVINGVISGINGAIKAINKLKIDIPEWVPEFGGKSFGFSIPTIPLLAKGAIVDKATPAIIGEAGKEAVLPLENNTQWIDLLADKLGAKMGGNSVVNNNFNYTFERMETTRLALHKAQLETKRIIGG